MGRVFLEVHFSSALSALVDRLVAWLSGSFSIQPLQSIPPPSPLGLEKYLGFLRGTDNDPFRSEGHEAQQPEVRTEGAATDPPQERFRLDFYPIFSQQLCQLARVQVSQSHSVFEKVARIPLPQVSFSAQVKFRYKIFLRVGPPRNLAAPLRFFASALQRIISQRAT